MLIKIITLITFVCMIVINALANILPINKITTGGVSDSYPNLFAPAAVTFSIWGLIYLLLAIYLIYQSKLVSDKNKNIVDKINYYFIISSIANSAWIFSWHFKMIGLSVIFMLIILFSLIAISKISNNKLLSFKERIFLKIPFGIYFGWITVATIANISTFLVSKGWNNFLLPDQTWMVITLIVGMLITSITTISQKNIAYGLVPVWAYFGIYLKHTSSNGFNYVHSNVITTSVICLLIFVMVITYLLVKRKSF